MSSDQDGPKAERGPGPASATPAGPLAQGTETLVIAPSDLASGTLVSGRYEILGRLGRGGMGSVYRALDREINEELALKTLSPDATADPRALERFRNELKLARRVAHKNVCRMYHLGEDAGTHYLIMELVEGEDLRAVLRREGKLDPGRAAALARQIAEGLAEAHRHGIVHRDLKPANVMIDREGTARIMDFGIARSFRGRGLTVTGALVGTPEYMSPEQVDGREVDARSDIYALGAMLYEMLTGRAPFEAETPLAAALMRRTADPPDPRGLEPGLPEGLSRVVLKCLAREPAERYRTAEGLAADLAAVGSGGTPDAAVRARAPIALPAKRRRVVRSAVTAAGLALAALVLSVLRKPGPPITSVAVLPLQNLSGDPEQDYFADGVTEDIIAQLSKIGELKVISRTSVWRYKNVSKSVSRIGRELGVGAVLEGSVRREGDRVRIVGQLIDARRDRHLWAETYDRAAGDIFAIQAEVAREIARELRIKLSPAEKKRLGRPATENVEAYAFYMRGREHYSLYTPEDNEKAIELFRRALELDPAYALAYAGLGDAYVMRVQSFGFPADGLGTALEMSRKALALDPDLAEGHKALGLVRDVTGDTAGALESYYRAVEINPSYAPVVSNIGSIHFEQGRYDEASKWLSKAVELQPGVARYYTLLALQYFYLGDDGRAGEWLRRALEFQPSAPFPRLVRAYIDLYSGRTETARRAAAAVLEDHPDEANALDAAGDFALIQGEWVEAHRHFAKLTESVSWRGMAGNKLAFTLMKLGRKNDAEDILRKNIEYCLELDNLDKPGSPVRYYLAQAYALLGRNTEALDSFEKAAANGYYDRWIAVDPLIEGIRGEPRFAEIMDKLNGRIAEMCQRVDGFRFLAPQLIHSAAGTKPGEMPS